MAFDNETGSSPLTCFIDCCEPAKDTASGGFLDVV